MPDVLVLVDPVFGDAGRLYVAQATAEAIRDALLPLATIATPNLFELPGSPARSPTLRRMTWRRARARLGPATVVVTSASQTPAAVATLLVDEKCIERASPRRIGIPNGAGDLFAGLFLGYLLNGCPGEAALDASSRRPRSRAGGERGPRRAAAGGALIGTARSARQQQSAIGHKTSQFSS